MGSRLKGGTFFELETTRQRFEEWRRTRPVGARIPKSLWSAAARMAARHGIHRTAKVLRVDYYSLQRRVQQESASGAAGDGVSTFIELAAPLASDTGECVLELERAGGEKMRVHLKGLAVPDLAALSRSFWGHHS
jgi:hypothetical protein